MSKARRFLGVALLAVGTSAQAAKIETGSLDFSAGVQDDGAIGVLLRGTEGGEIGWFTSPAGKASADRVGESDSRSLGLYQWLVDAGWQSGSVGSDVSRISLQASIGRVYGTVVETTSRKGCDEKVQVVPLLEPPPPPKHCRFGLRDDFLIQAFVDASHRVGGEPDVVTRSRVKQTSFGIGLSLWYLDLSHPLLVRYPKLSLAYAHTTSGQGTPSNDKDRVLLEAGTRLRVPSLADFDKPTRVSVDLGYSWSHDLGDTPDEAEAGLVTVQALYDLDGPVTPTLVYRAGRESGFEYDKQLFLGISTPIDVLR